MQFSHSPRELRKIRTILIYALNKYFQIPDHRQSTPGNYSELHRFQTIRTTQQANYAKFTIFAHQSYVQFLLQITHLVIAHTP